jgi:hypothetical protein
LLVLVGLAALLVLAGGLILGRVPVVALGLSTVLSAVVRFANPRPGRLRPGGRLPDRLTPSPGRTGLIPGT